MSPLIALAFFLSGFAGLVYETIWARYLGLFLGHRAYSQVLVLVIFLGGTAAGALATAARTRRLRRPLLAYVIVEAAVGALGLVFHQLYVATTNAAYDRFFPALGGEPAILLLAQWTLAAALILPQSILLGTTFPLVSAAQLRAQPSHSGRVLAQLYSLNALGGAIGVLVAGFWLVGRVGLNGAILAGGLASIAAALAAVAPAWRESPSEAGKPAPVVLAEAPLVFPLRALRLALLGVAFGTAVTSLAYEVAWTRLLSLLLGTAAHSFELMLSAFVLGIALGAMYLRSRADRLRDPVGTLGVVQSLMGSCAVLSLPLYFALFHLMAALLAALAPSAQGYLLFTIARYGLCLAIMLPTTLCAGLTFPLVTDALLRSTKNEGSVGLAYGVNTVGAIAGAIVGGLVLLPLIGARGLLVAAALGDVALGLMLLWLRASRPHRAAMPLGFAVACLVLVIGTAWQSPLDRAVITAGVFRTRRLPEPGLQKILFYHDGRTATVSAAYTPPGRTTLSTNGKVDASLDDAWYHRLPAGAPRRALGDDAGTQTLMPIVALAYRPDARRSAVIGHGSGMSAHFLLGSPNMESVTTVEIEPQMILGSAVFYPVNRRVFDDSRSHFVNADARSFFSSSPTQYDLIVSEPSNPWVSGVSSLFTREFYARASRRLTPSGVFVQWVQMYEISDSLLLDIVGAVHRSFRSYALYRTGAVDMIVVASNAPEPLTPDWSVVRWPALATDLSDLVPFTAQSLDALRFADRAVFAPLLDRLDTPSSDFLSSLDRDAEQERFLGKTASGFVSLADERFDPFMALTGRRYAVGTEASTPFPEVARAHEAAIAARIHGNDVGGMRPVDAETNALLMRVQMFETFIAGNAAPKDWQIWVRNFILVERTVHGLASGTADENFYTRVQRYLQRAHAPSGAIESVALYHALAVWDFNGAVGSVDHLLPALALGITWIPTSTLRDAGVVAKLLTGDIAGARRVFETLTPPMERASLRARLLEAHLRAMEERDRA